jgi:hypothetical protein
MDIHEYYENRIYSLKTFAQNVQRRTEDLLEAISKQRKDCLQEVDLFSTRLAETKDFEEIMNSPE